LVERVVAKLEKNGDADKLLEAQIRDDMAGTLQKLSPYAPKQVEALVTHSIEDYVTKQTTLQANKTPAIEHDSPTTKLH